MSQSFPVSDALSAVRRVADGRRINRGVTHHPTLGKESSLESETSLHAC